jgi:hypothetical protein
VCPLTFLNVTSLSLILLVRIIPVLVLDIIEILSTLGLNKYDTWRILPVKCYIDNSVHIISLTGLFVALCLFMVYTG